MNALVTVVLFLRYCVLNRFWLIFDFTAPKPAAAVGENVVGKVVIFPILCFKLASENFELLVHIAAVQNLQKLL